MVHAPHLRRSGLLLGLLAALWVPQDATAQTPGREPPVVEVVPGARAMGLGMVVPVGSNDPDVAFVHPALAGGLQGMQAGLTRFDGPASAFTFAGAMDWFGGGVALSLHALEYRREVTATPGIVLHTTLDGLGDDPASGEGVGEQAATLTYAREVLGLQFGVSGRLHTQHGGDEREAGESFDVGAATSLGPLDAALSVRNLGRGDDLPTSVVLGVGGYGQPVGPLDVGGAWQLEYRADREFVFSGGVEVGYWPIRGRTFVGRLGLRDVKEGDASPLTFGGSFWGDSLVLDYAFQPVDGQGGIHRVSVGWR